jgi:hypothetical protein
MSTALALIPFPCKKIAQILSELKAYKSMILNFYIIQQINIEY